MNSPDRQQQPPQQAHELPEAIEGNLFVSAYPPFSCWQPQHVAHVEGCLQATPGATDRTPLGIYLHVPFCLERCQFCYYHSYAGQSLETVDRYLDAVERELQILASSPRLADRRPEFVYFGGGTPSLLSPRQLRKVFGDLQTYFPLSNAREITFEVAPKSVASAGLELLRDAGVTRVSMGVQELNDDVLRQNGRIHLIDDVQRAYAEIQRFDFDQVNIDLIVGLVGQSDQSFLESLSQVVDMAPDSITLYQLEIPRNTPLHHRLQQGPAPSMATWSEKRTRLDQAFTRLEENGFSIRSAYTAVRDPSRHPFVYQEAQYHGADLLGVGVTSFSYLEGIHYQNVPSLRAYLESLENRRQPVGRAYVLNAEEQLVREFSLRLKLGGIDRLDFRRKFDVEVTERFSKPLARFADRGWLVIDASTIRLTRQGLLRVDRMIPAFFLPRHQDVSYW